MYEIALKTVEPKNCLVFFNLVQLLKDLTEYQTDLDKILHIRCLVHSSDSSSL